VRGSNGISAKTVKLVAGKELLEALRDRRTLFVALVLPMLLYPLIMLGVAPLVSMQKQKLQEEKQKIVVTGEGRDALIEAVLPAGEDGGEDAVRLEVAETADPAAALAAGEVALWIEADAAFAEALGGDETAELVVHRDPQRMTLVVPAPALEAGLAQHPGAELLDEAALLGDVDEVRGPQHAAYRVVPAHQRLHAHQAAAVAGELRLVVQAQLLLVHHVAQLGLDQHPVADALVQRRGQTA